MKRRLREKRRVGEFRELGIDLRVHLSVETDVDSFLDEFIEEAVERNGLQFGGGFQSGVPVVEGFLELGRVDAMAANLSMVRRWLESHTAVESFDCGKHTDVNDP